MGKMVTVREYAQIKGQAYSAVSTRVRKGQIPARKSGKIWLIDEDTPWAALQWGGDRHTDKRKVGKGNMLTVKEYAELNGKTEEAVKSMIAAKRLLAEKVGNILLIEAGTPYPADMRGKTVANRPETYRKKPAAPHIDGYYTLEEYSEVTVKRVPAIKNYLYNGVLNATKIESYWYIPVGTAYPEPKSPGRPLGSKNKVK